MILFEFCNWSKNFAPVIVPTNKWCIWILSWCTILCFSASQIFEESYVKEGSKYFHTYANKVFGGWDMCIEDEAAGKLQRMRIVIEIEVRLIPSLLNYNFFKRQCCTNLLLGNVSWNHGPSVRDSNHWKRPNSAFQYLGRFLKVNCLIYLLNKTLGRLGKSPISLT